MLKINKAAVAIFTASLVVGCSSGSSSSSDDDDDVTSSGLSGKVADGYLTGAKVCLDLNQNKVCDDGEPFAMSTEGGEFTISDATDAQIEEAPLLVEIIVGETIDEDNPGTPIDRKYTLSAPAGYEFISPLTTMVQSEMEDSGLTLNEAEGAIQAKLDTTLDLGADYVEGAAGAVNADEFERLHQVAQVTAVVMQNNIEVAERVLDESDISLEDLLELVVAQVLEALDDISTEIANMAGDFNPATLADSDNLDDANLEAGRIEEEMAERRALRTSETVNIANVLNGGESLHFFDGDGNFNGAPEFNYGTVAIAQGSTVVISNRIYNPANDQWELEAVNDDDEQICVLSAGTFNCVDEDAETISVEGDAVVVKVGNLDATRSEITGMSVDLSGQHISAFMRHFYLPVMNLRSEFGNGVTGYRLSFDRTNDMYAIHNENVNAITDCHGGQAQAGLWNPEDTYCNNVYLITGDGNGGNDGASATTLDQLITATPVSAPQTRENIKGTPVYGDGVEAVVEFVEGGVANYYMINSGNQNNTVEGLLTGRWERVTHEGRDIIRYTLPGLLIELGDMDRDERTRFFVVENNYVRHGGIDPAGVRSDGNEWVFNNAGRDQILAAFGFDLRTAYTACTTGDVSYDPFNAAQNPGGALADFDTAVGNCNGVNFVADDVNDTTLLTDFGFLEFRSNGTGTFFGDLNGFQNLFQEFTWSLENNRIIINTRITEGTNLFLKFTLVKIEANDRQIHIKSFVQGSLTEAGLANARGDISGTVWELH